MLIYQLTNCTAYQMMGYVIKTDGGKVIVIDGGGFEQSSELYKVLELVGKNVDMWFLTHTHNDHYGAVVELMKEHNDICAGGLWRSVSTSAQVIEQMTENEKRQLNEWLECEKELNIPLHKLSLNQEFDVDNVHIEVLGIDNPDIFVNNSNNQSVVLKFTEGDFSILFLADLGIEGGEKLVKSAGEKVKSTAVQMAHHGQGGVDKAVYEFIGARYAFWPTPKWLWDNTPYLGGEPGKGHFATPETIKWMEDLGTINVTSFDSTIVFDTKNKKWKNI